MDDLIEPVFVFHQKYSEVFPDDPQDGRLKGPDEKNADNYSGPAFHIPGCEKT
jgi:hypothetical protein